MFCASCNKIEVCCSVNHREGLVKLCVLDVYMYGSNGKYYPNSSEMKLILS